jgi:molecular chaperone GrpE
MTARKKVDKNMHQDNEEGLPEQLEANAAEVPPQPESDDPIERLETELQAARLEATEAREDMLRMQADMENLRKRLVREHEKSRLRTLERFMNDLLPVRDSLERGLEAASDPAATVEALTEGKQLIMKMLSKAMGDHGLKTIDPLGKPFDPEKHEAMTMLTSDAIEENTVIDVIEKGYLLHDRLIRPAKVVVSRKP